MAKTIKIDPRGRGRWGYEDYLIGKHARELDRYMFDRNWPVAARLAMRRIHHDIVTRQTVLSLYGHPVKLFVRAVRQGTIGKLFGTTSATVIPAKENPNYVYAK